MNLSDLKNLAALPQGRSTPPKAPQRVAAKTPSPPTNGSIGNPNSFANARTRNAQRFQAQGSMQGALDNLATLAGQPQRVQSPPQHSSKSQNFLQKMGQQLKQATAPTQLSQLAQIKARHQISISLQDILPSSQPTSVSLDLNQIAERVTQELLRDFNGTLPQLSFTDSDPALAQALSQSIDDQLGTQLKLNDKQELKARVTQALQKPEIQSLIARHQSPPQAQYAAPHKKPVQSTPPIAPVQRLSAPVHVTPTQAPQGVRPTARVSAGKTRQLSDAQVNQASKNYQAQLKAKLKAAPTNSSVGRYYRLSRSLNEYRQYQQAQKTGTSHPLQKDPDALRLLEANHSKMKAELTRLSQDSKVQAVFQSARQTALKATFGSDYKKVAQEYSNHLLSDGFEKQLRNASPQERKALITKSIMKLSSLDPKLAQETLQKLALKQLESQFQSKLKGSDPKAKAAAKASTKKIVEDYLKSQFGNVSKGNKVAEMAADMLANKVSKNPKLLLSKAGLQQALQDIGQSLKKSGQIPSQLAEDLDSAARGMNRVNLRGSILSGAALITGVLTFQEGRGKKDYEKMAAGVSGMLEGVSGAANMGKLLDTAALSKMKGVLGVASDTGVLKVLSKAGALGPLGDLIGVGADVMGAIRESKNEDPVGMYLKIASAGAGTAGMVAGIALLAGASGPAAPVVAAGAAIVGVGTAVADSYFAESDKTGEIRVLLRDLGISKQSDAFKTKVEKHLGYVYDNPDQVLNEFNKLKTADERTMFVNALLDRKQAWLNSGRAHLVADMLNSMTHSELKGMMKAGLHMGMLGRILGEFPQASTRIATRLNTALGQDSSLSTQSTAFLKGLVDGGHHGSFVKIMQSKGLGDSLVPRLKQGDVQDLVSHLGKSKKRADQADRFKSSASDHDQSMFWLLHKSSWSQFNALFSGPHASDNKQTLRSVMTDTDTPSRVLSGRFASWGRFKSASPEAQRFLYGLITERLKNTTSILGAVKMADMFISQLDKTQLKALPKDLLRQLYSIYEVAEVNNDAFKKLAASVSKPTR